MFFFQEKRMKQPQTVQTNQKKVHTILYKFKLSKKKREMFIASDSSLNAPSPGQELYGSGLAREHGASGGWAKKIQVVLDEVQEEVKKTFFFGSFFF